MATTDLHAPAPQVEIGYAQNVNYNWWLYDQETTPELIWPQSTFVFDQMRRTDSQVTSVLRAMTLPVRRTQWRIDPNGARPDVARFIADDLGLPVVGEKSHKPPPRSKDRFSWAEHLRQALLMLSYGHMYFEQVYRVDEDGQQAHLRKLAPRMPKTIERIDVGSDGGLISIKQYWTNHNSAAQVIPVNRIVAYIHEREGGNWLGTSILRPAYKNWLLKDRLLRVQAQTIERNGMGIPLYKAAEGATEMATGLAMAKAWRAGDAAGSAVPFGADLILRGVEGTLPDAEPAIRYHDEQIGRAVLAHFLNLGTQTGSWALGTTFADFFTLSLQTLADQVADIATQHIIEDLVDINFGEDEPAPRMVCDEIGSRQAATAEALASLIDSGVIRPDEVLEQSSRQQYGLPPADPKTTRTPPTPGGGQPPIPTDGSPTPGDITPDAAATPDPTATDASAAVAAMQSVSAAAADDLDERIEAALARHTMAARYLRPSRERVAAKFDPKQPRVPGGRAGGGEWGTGIVGDALNLAGKIDLQPGETLHGSSKVSGDFGTARMAATEHHGARSLRIGIGNSAFGSRDDEAGPWRAGRHDLQDRNTKAAALGRERTSLESEYETLATARDPLVAKYRATAHGGPALTDAEHAHLEHLSDRRDEIANRLDEIDHEDTDQISASGHTTKLGQAQVEQLRASLADLVKRGKDALPAHEAAWDAIPDGTMNGDIPYTDLGKGAVPGEWGDVQYAGFIDEPDAGPQFVLSVTPHGMQHADVEQAEQNATFDEAELRKLIGQLGRLMPNGSVRASAEVLPEDHDETTAALIEGIAVYLADPIEAKFNPGEERIPGGKGGGRWTAGGGMVGKIAHALEEWGKGNGPDDPFHIDGKPIDREPLRRAAVVRGITLKRGASRDDIVAALKDHVRGEAKVQREAKTTLRDSAKFSIDHGGKRIDVGVFAAKSGRVQLREQDDHGKPGRLVKSSPDLAALETWADANGHKPVADWARSEQARLGHTPAPAKGAKKAAPAKALEPAGTVRAEGYSKGANAQLRVVADGNGGYKGQQQDPTTSEWHDHAALGTGNTVKDVTSRMGSAWRGVAPSRKTAPAKAAKKAVPKVDAEAKFRTEMKKLSPPFGNEQKRQWDDARLRALGYQDKTPEDALRQLEADITANEALLREHEASGTEPHLQRRTVRALPDDIARQREMAQLIRKTYGLPAKKAAPKTPRATKAAKAAPHPDGLDSMEPTALGKYAREFEVDTNGKTEAEIKAALRAQGVGSPDVEAAKRAAEEAAAPKVKAGPTLAQARLDNSILSTYQGWAISGRPGAKNGGLPVEDLRRKFPDVPSAEFDAAIKRIEAHGAETTGGVLRVTHQDTAHLPARDWPALPVSPAQREAAITDRVEQTYQELTHRPGGFVALADVRDRVGPDVSKAELDRILIEMSFRPDVKIVPESNQKMLSRRDRDAAAQIGNQDRHLIAVQPEAGGARPKGEGRAIRSSAAGGEVPMAKPAKYTPPPVKKAAPTKVAPKKMAPRKSC